jgi:ArsR family transcriptional regulator, arsenate/arsenite/antimonite-responsive transcriptional repressor
MRKAAYASPPTQGSGAAFLRLLADDTRLRILNLLLRTSDLCVCELVAILRLPQYQISRHLGPMRRSGLLTTERRGPFVFYGVAEQTRRNPVQRAILRAVPQLAASPLGPGDVGRMRRLMRLENTQRVASCMAASAASTVRARPILRAVNAKPT